MKRTFDRYNQTKQQKFIVTAIVPAATFFRSEEYHQRDAEKHGGVTCGIPPRK